MSDSSHNISETVSALEHDAPFWRAPWVFAVHSAVGTCIFLIIAGFAVVLALAVRILKTYSTDIVIIFGLELAEYALFGFDLVIFGVFLWRTAKRTIKNL
jgi:hypothetical protein